MRWNPLSYSDSRFFFSVPEPGAVSKRDPNEPKLESVPRRPAPQTLSEPSDPTQSGAGSARFANNSLDLDCALVDLSYLA